LMLTVSGAASADCGFPPPARVRSSAPMDGEMGVPTSIVVRVGYATGSQAEHLCGARPGAPAIRMAAAADGGVADGGAPDGGAPTVAGQWVRGTDDDPHATTIWLFEPAQPLAPNTTYELSDTWPASCPCVAGMCQPTADAVFARFTTGAGPDNTKPTFGGLIGTSCYRDFCAANDTMCCGPYDHFTYTFYDKRDEADDHIVGVHLYVRTEAGPYDFSRPLGPRASGAIRLSDPYDSVTAFGLDYPFVPGTYHAIARAFDSSGNEDGNLVDVTFHWPLKDDPLCKVFDGGVDDLAQPPPDDLAVASDLGGGTPPKGCGCAVGARATGGWMGAAVLIGLVSLARGLRRSRRGGRGGRS
jgi:hypothetical protein